MGFGNGNKILLEPVTIAHFMPEWSLLISNTYCCTASDSRCSTYCTAILHLSLMSNPHPLRPLFMTFKPVAHPLLPIVVATVSLSFPNDFGSSTFRLEYSLIARPKTPARHLQQHEQSIAPSYKHNDSKSNKIV